MEPTASTGLTVLEPSEEDRIRFLQLSVLLRQAEGSAVFLSFERAVEACRHLARRLVDSVGRESLEASAWRAIPRGGHVVLGFLAYALDLDAETLRRRAADAEQVILVDDCLLSGFRLAEYISELPNAEIGVAHLCSVPAARRAVLEAEPRVRFCEAASDLPDHTETIVGETLDEWRSSWRRRLTDERYWIGLPGIVGFAWSEPDYPLWNEAAGRVESGWRFFPPDRCLRNRARLGWPLGTANPRWRVADEVVAGYFGDRVLLYHRRDDRGYTLGDVAAEMWRQLAACGDVDGSVEELRRRWQVDPERLRRDLTAFARTLADRRLLEAVPE